MNKKGQALIEFIIILPIFVMIMLAVFDFVKIYNEKSKMESFIEELILDNKMDNDEYFIESKNENGFVTYDVSKKIDISSPILGAIIGNKYEISIERTVYE